MRAYVEVSEGGRSLLRVRDALIRWAPASVEFTKRRAEADLVVMHVNGRVNRYRELADHLTARGQRYAVVQYAVRSTKTPSTLAWTPLWLGAVAVWSYLYLSDLIAEDGQSPAGLVNFYSTALGVAPECYAEWARTRGYFIGTSGLSWLTEGVREAASAAWRVKSNARVFHLGPQVYPGLVARRGMDDQTLALEWARCHYVSGLRRIEGFELPAAEGLVCGARPVLFDREHYRHWYGDLAEYVPEGSRPEVMDSLEALFRSPRRPVIKAEGVEARKRFDWPRIIGGFWERCGA